MVRSSGHTPGAICFILLRTIRVGWLVFHFVLLRDDVKYFLVTEVGCACCSALPSFPLSLLHGETLVFKLWLISPCNNPKPVHTVVCVPVVRCILGGTPTGWAGGRRAHRKAQILKVLFVGRRKKVSGRRKTQSRSSVKSRSSGTGAKRRQSRVKKRKGRKSKVALEGSVPTVRVSSLVQPGGGMHRKSLLVLY